MYSIHPPCLEQVWPLGGAGSHPHGLANRSSGYAMGFDLKTRFQMQGSDGASSPVHGGGGGGGGEDAVSCRAIAAKRQGTNYNEVCLRQYTELLNYSFYILIAVLIAFFMSSS